MNENLKQLYDRLYANNFKELKRKKEKLEMPIILFIIYIFTCIILFFLCFIIVQKSLFILLGISSVLMFVFLILFESKPIKKIKNIQEKEYRDCFKKKIAKPIIEDMLKNSTYFPNQGITEDCYNKGFGNEKYTIYVSEDLVTSEININKENTINIEIAQVNTLNNTNDSQQISVFHGTVTSFNISKNIDTSIYVVPNGKFAGIGNKVNMDVDNFEKMFDVICEDKILAMQILTSDVMLQFIELYKKYKYKFEVRIVNDTVYLRIHCGDLFEPNTFTRKIFEYKQVEKYFYVLSLLIDIATNIYKNVESIAI